MHFRFAHYYLSWISWIVNHHFEVIDLLCRLSITLTFLSQCCSELFLKRLHIKICYVYQESNRQTNSSRLAAFIDDTTVATTLHSEDQKFPLTSTTAFDPIQTKYEFRFDRRMMDTLVAWFAVAKNKNRRDSFPF